MTGGETCTEKLFEHQHTKLYSSDYQLYLKEKVVTFALHVILLLADED